MEYHLAREIKNSNGAVLVKHTLHFFVLTIYNLHNWIRLELICALFVYSAYLIKDHLVCIYSAKSGDHSYLLLLQLSRPGNSIIPKPTTCLICSVPFHTAGHWNSRLQFSWPADPLQTPMKQQLGGGNKLFSQRVLDHALYVDPRSEGWSSPSRPSAS